MYALCCFIAPILNVSKYAGQFHIYGTYTQELTAIMSVLVLFQILSIGKNINKDRIKPKK